MSSTDDDDPLFTVLSTRLRCRIDDAFDSIASTGDATREPEYDPGGFIVEEVRQGAQSYILLSEIPRALSLLGLSVDEDVMEVFKNAAAGWGAQSARNDGINRKDWRAVCAALLEEEGDEEVVADQDIEIGSDSGPDSDEYQSGDTGDDSGDEYEEPNERATRPRSDRAKEVATTGQRESLSESQKAQCRQDFARFFPHVPDNELDQQRIMVKDINRVADLLKENLKAEEILEMLDTFSTSPDKSMNLTDFEHMMILTKLI